VSGRTALLVDCDTGIDDALALLYLAGSPEADLRAVTCTGGNVDARQVAANTRAVLALAGRPDVPVALGREAPLGSSSRRTRRTRGSCRSTGTSATRRHRSRSSPGASPRTRTVRSTSAATRSGTVSVPPGR